MLPGSVSAAWLTLMRKAGLEGIRLHDARHTFGTRMADTGLNAAALKRIMGHSDFRTTVRYVHDQKDVQRKAVDLFDEMMTGQKQKAELQQNAHRRGNY